MTYVLDRFEEAFAILSPDGDGKQLILPRADFESRREGDVFVMTDGVLVFDSELTEIRRKQVNDRYRQLVKRKPKTK